MAQRGRTTKRKQATGHSGTLNSDSRPATYHRKRKKKDNSKDSNAKPTWPDPKLLFPADKFPRILVVGDGDFTFSLALARHLREQGPLRKSKHGHSKDTRLLVTSLDSADEVGTKYPGAERTLDKLRKLGVNVKHGVDATKLQQYFSLKGKRLFNAILFNFPHTGMQRVHLNRALVRDFFASARLLLAREGEIHMTIKMGRPYVSWGIEHLAKESGMLVKHVLKFHKSMYPGYSHQTTLAGAESVMFNRFTQCRTFVFADSNPTDAERLRAVAKREVTEQKSHSVPRKPTAPTPVPNQTSSSSSSSSGPGSGGKEVRASQVKAMKDKLLSLFDT